MNDNNSEMTGNADMNEEATHPSFREMMFEVWITPELRRRNSKEPVTKAIVEFGPGCDEVVRLNDEAGLILTATCNRDLTKGEDVRSGDIDDISITPLEIRSNSGWMALAVLSDGRNIIAFDFRRNRERASKKIERAAEYLDEVDIAIGAARLAPAVDMLQAAYELAIQSLKGELWDVARGSHKTKATWIARWARDGNAPLIHKGLMGKLMKLRQDARYAEKELTVTSEELLEMRNVVRKFAEDARFRI